MIHNVGRRPVARLAAQLLIILIAVPAFAMGKDAGGREASFEPAAQKKKSTSRTRKPTAKTPTTKTSTTKTSTTTTPAKTDAKSQPAQATASGNRTAIIETNHGVIKIELLADQAPTTAENFRLLAERGYYNGLTFHRVISGFMIQGRRPQRQRHGRRDRFRPAASQ